MNGLRKLLLSLLALVFLSGSELVWAQSPDSSRVNRQRLYWTLGIEGAAYVGGISYLSFVWYKDAQRVPFHTYNDNAGYLQIDKLGHAYAAYLESYAGYRALRSAGVSKGKSLLYGGTLGILLQTPIEVFDGLYASWGFSWGDMAANTAGSLLLIGQELAFDEQLVRMKFSFWRSPYARQSYGYLGDNVAESLFYDYNGHSYWLSLPANTLLPEDPLPDWLCLSLGYSANGMLGEFTNRRTWGPYVLPEYTRERQFLLSLDVDWTRIPTQSRWLRMLFEGLNFVKIPFPALELTSQGQFRGYWLYF